MTASMPPRLLPSTRIQVDLAHDVSPWPQAMPLRASSMRHVNSHFRDP
jgi:hypothetical protein